MRNLFLVLAVLLAFACNKEDSDPCADVVCMNEGFCANGLCNCVDGYEGSDCSIQSDPKSITIERISIDGWPPVDENGGAWDPIGNTGPDPAIRIVDESVTTRYTGDYYIDPQQGSVLDWYPNLKIDDPAGEGITLLLLDFDGGDTYYTMGGVAFTLYTKEQNATFPEILRFESVDGKITGEMELEYRF